MAYHTSLRCATLAAARTVASYAAKLEKEGFRASSAGSGPVLFSAKDGYAPVDEASVPLTVGSTYVYPYADQKHSYGNDGGANTPVHHPVPVSV